jgi:hypothetical protein
MRRLARVWLGCGVLALVPAGPQSGPETGAPAATAPSAAQAVADYTAERYAAAFAAFAVLGAESAAPPPELRLGLALAALRVQRTGDAEAALRPLLAEAALLAEAPALAAEAQFVFGLLQWQRAERAQAAAQLQDAEPFALASARRAAALAMAAFCAADRARGGWPAALRNAERAARLDAELERLAAAQQPPKAQKEPDQPPPPEPEPERQPTQEEQAPELAREALSAAAAAELLARVQQREREKLQVRRAGQRRGSTAGERDW